MAKDTFRANQVRRKVGERRQGLGLVGLAVGVSVCVCSTALHNPQLLEGTGDSHSSDTREVWVPFGQRFASAKPYLRCTAPALCLDQGQV